MRSHAKASTAGSTQRQAGRLGRFFRKADATRGSLRGAKGSGAPVIGRLIPPFVFAGILGVLVLIAGPAGASVYVSEGAFGSAAQPSFTDARDIAIDQSSGDVLVMDADGTPSIKRYNADGTPADFSALGTNVIDGQGSGDETPQGGLGFASAGEAQIAVDNSGTATDGDIYVTQNSPNVIDVFSKTGAYLGQLSESSGGAFREACGVAVDPSGAVYVGDYSGGIHKFVPAANPPTNADNTVNFNSVTNPCTLAAGAATSAGFLFAAEYNGAVLKLDNSTGEVKYTASPGPTRTVEVNPTTGHLFAAKGSLIEEYDASASGASLASTISAPGVVQGVGVDANSGDAFLSSSGEANLAVFGLPRVDTGTASNRATTGATLNGTVKPEGVVVEECLFEYGPTSSYGQSAPCAESSGVIGTGTNRVPVHADISGLSVGATYHFRLVIKDANGTTAGEDGAFKTLTPQLIDGAWASDVLFKEASLNASINPKGTASTFHFEYGTTASYGQSTAEREVGSDNADHTVTTALDGLTPGISYHWRVVVSSSLGVTEGPDGVFTTYSPLAPDTTCPNQAFRTASAANLPNCRAYEMVSPIDKGGNSIDSSVVFGSHIDYRQSSLDGNKMTYSSGTAFGDAKSSLIANQYLASRGEYGWSTHGISPPLGTTISDPHYDATELTEPFKAFTPDLSSGWTLDFNKTPLTPDAVEGHYANLYRVDTTNDSYQALTINEPIGFTHLYYPGGIGGYSKDLSHVILVAEARLTPDAAPALNERYRQLYDFTGGALHLVSVLPDDTPAETAEALSVSEDGSRVFWISGPSNQEVGEPASRNSGPIYVRIDGATTVRLLPDAARFWGATPDGTKALVGEDVGNRNLYEVDVGTQVPTLVAPHVLGVAGASKDLSYVYFGSEDDLAPGATAGERNLYLAHEGTITFIATLSRADTEESNGEHVVSGPSVLQSAGPSRVTPDGRHLAFQSINSLTGYDNTDANNGEPDLEVYTYDAEADRLTCASCRRSGARPEGEPLLAAYTNLPDLPLTNNGGPERRWTAAWLPTREHMEPSTRTLSDDGKHLFFNSFDALVPQDTNGTQDVYEWEAQGVGGCQSADGCIGLISSGESPATSQFIDASPAGRDVFFETSSSLVPQDPGLIDIYDARSGGGFPQPSGPPECAGDACQSVPAAPDEPTPASAGFKGAGNPTSRKARHSCRARKGHGARKGQRAKHKATKRCKGAKRGAGR